MKRKPRAVVENPYAGIALPPEQAVRVVPVGLTLGQLVVLASELHLGIDCLRESNPRSRILRAIAAVVDATLTKEAPEYGHS